MFLPALILLGLAPPDPHPHLFDDWDAARLWAAENETSLMRVELETPGGSLPFVIEFQNALQDGPRAQPELDHRQFFRSLRGHIHNGEDSSAMLMHVSGGGYGGPSQAWIDFGRYGSSIRATGTGSCITPSILPRHFLRWGTWSLMLSGAYMAVDLVAYPIDDLTDRFDAIYGNTAPASFRGRWFVDFASTNEVVVGVFEVDDELIATGTFVTPTGDYRHLAGRVDGDLMRLSFFDGIHAYLFHARMQPDGSLSGDFWSGNWHHETWTAVRDDGARLPDSSTPTEADR